MEGGRLTTQQLWSPKRHTSMLGNAEKLFSLNYYPHAKLGDPVAEKHGYPIGNMLRKIKTPHARLSKTTQ